jgi:hypothetical protein
MHEIGESHLDNRALKFVHHISTTNKKRKSVCGCVINHFVFIQSNKRRDQKKRNIKKEADQKKRFEFSFTCCPMKRSSSF